MIREDIVREVIGKLSDAAERDQDGLYWYPRKIMAEHAAAARALDCLMMREPGGGDGSKNLFGGLKPYWPSQKPRWPIEHIPARILERLSLKPPKNIDQFERGDGDKIDGTQKTAESNRSTKSLLINLFQPKTKRKRRMTAPTG